MKIVNAIELAKLPEGVIYSEYEPCILGDLKVKGEVLSEGNETEWAHWYDADINHVEHMLDELKAGDSSPVGIIYGGDVHEPEELFAVWELEDLKELREVINKAIGIMEFIK